jgi:hypothetical protein
MSVLTSVPRTRGRSANRSATDARETRESPARRDSRAEAAAAGVEPPHVTQCHKQPSAIAPGWGALWHVHDMSTRSGRVQSPSASVRSRTLREALVAGL